MYSISFLFTLYIVHITGWIYIIFVIFADNKMVLMLVFFLLICRYKLVATLQLFERIAALVPICLPRSFIGEYYVRRGKRILGAEG